MKLYLCYAIFWSIVLSGCMTPKEKLDRIISKHPQLGSEFCANEYPLSVIDSTTIIDSVRRADNVNWQYYIDSLNKVAESRLDDRVLIDTVTIERCREEYNKQVETNRGLVNAINRLKREYQECKPDTQYIKTTLRVRDTAREQVLRDSINSLRTDLNKVTDQKETRTTQRNWLFAIVLVVVGYIGLRLFRVF